MEYEFETTPVFDKWLKTQSGDIARAKTIIKEIEL